MKVAIIGGGIAGSLMAGAVSNYSPVIYEARSGGDALADHKAIIRIRDPRIALLLGCSVTPVEVQKAIYFGGELHNHPTIETNNLYSLKTYGEIGLRSLGKMEAEERFLLKGDIFAQCEFGHKLVKVREDRRLTFDADTGIDVTTFGSPEKEVTTGKQEHEIEYDFCISTIPLPVLARLCGMEFDRGSFPYRPITVGRGRVARPSSVHQTIYVPEPKFSTYRLTLQEDDLIIEAMTPLGRPEEEELEELIALFGLGREDVPEVTWHTQKFGKLLRPLSEDLRRNLIWEMTQKFRIFSFGRFGIWKPIRTDHLLEDAEKIKKMMDLFTHSDQYSLFKMRVEEAQT